MQSLGCLFEFLASTEELCLSPSHPGQLLASDRVGAPLDQLSCRWNTGGQAGLLADGPADLRTWPMLPQVASFPMRNLLEGRSSEG